jgi:hypothetical protein
VIRDNFQTPNETIYIENLNEYKEYLESISFQTKCGKTILFTNGNGWYISTLIKNLILSMDINDSSYRGKMGVICTDQEALDTCQTLNMVNSFLVKIPLLNIDLLTRVNNPEDYTRLVFVKIVLIYYALQFGYSIIYIDPDMAFLSPSIDYIIDKMSENMLVLAGIKEGNMNTNIIAVTPSSNLTNLFHVDVHTFEANILNRKLYNRFCGSDEEFLIIKDEYTPDSFHFLDIELFPPGLYVKDSNKIMMLHANDISGLVNKVSFLIKHKGWFLPTFVIS